MYKSFDQWVQCFWLVYCLLDRKTLSPAYLHPKDFSIPGHSMLWSVNRCGVFPRVTLFSTLLLELTALEEDCLAAQCRMAVKSCQLSVEGHGRQSCSACTQHSVAGSVARNPACYKSLCGAASIYNKYHSKSRNRIPLCASRHRARQLVLNGSNTSVPAALGMQAAQEQHCARAGCSWPMWVSLLPPRNGGGCSSISTPLPSGFGQVPSPPSFADSVQCGGRLSLPV